MAKKVSSNNKLASKFNKRKSEEITLEHKGGGFPDGIENGVAQITTIKLGTYESGDAKGKNYFMVRGVALLPKKLADGTPVEGSQDSLIMEPLHSTPARSRKTEDEHLDYMIGVLQEFGLDTNDYDWEDLVSGEIFKDIIDNGLYCRFRTWSGQPTKQYPNPRINVTYSGVTDYEPVETDDEVVDETDEEAVDEVEDVEEVEEQQDDNDTEEIDYAALGEAADNGDEDAAAQLEALAEEAGVDSENVNTWEEVAVELAALAESEGDESDEEEVEEEPEETGIPVKGEVYKYKPAGAKKPLNVEVITVNKTKETCNLKNVATGKVYKLIKWEKIS